MLKVGEVNKARKRAKGSVTTEQAKRAIKERLAAKGRAKKVGKEGFKVHKEQFTGLLRQNEKLKEEHNQDKKKPKDAHSIVIDQNIQLLEQVSLLQDEIKGLKYCI